MDSLSVLLSHGATVNCHDISGLSPLHLSTDHGVVTRLLEHGADPCITSNTNHGEEKVTMTAFSHLLRTVPEECATLLTSQVTTNHLSLSASNLELRLSFRLWQKETKQTESDGLLRLAVKFLTSTIKIKITNVLGSSPTNRWIF